MFPNWIGNLTVIWPEWADVIREIGERPEPNENKLADLAKELREAYRASGKFVVSLLPVPPGIKMILSTLVDNGVADEVLWDVAAKASAEFIYREIYKPLYGVQ